MTISKYKKYLEEMERQRNYLASDNSDFGSDFIAVSNEIIIGRNENVRRLILNILNDPSVRRNLVLVGRRDDILEANNCVYFYPEESI